RPVAFAVGQLVAPAKDKRPAAVAAFAGERALLKRQVQFHHALLAMLKKIARPRPTGKARIGFQHGRFGLAHDIPAIENRAFPGLENLAESRKVAKLREIFLASWRLCARILALRTYQAAAPFGQDGVAPDAVMQGDA